ncbi:MAG: PsbP-related protein [Cyanobacteria bacterium P01_G01_bin.39]
MSTNSDQDNQETAETSKKSPFSGITIGLREILILAIATAIGTVIANYVNQEGLLKRYVSYENSDYGIELKYPKNWSVQEKLDTWQPEVNLVSPLENDIDDFQERVTIAIENLSQPLSIREYETEATAQIEVDNIIVKSAQKINFANREGRTITYQEKNGNKKRMEVWMIRNQQVYIATYTAEEESFDKFANQADQIIESVIIY